jgi:hypothetical protein
MTSRPSTAAAILAALAIVVLSLGAYVGAYFWLGQLTKEPGALYRSFGNGWPAWPFGPAAKVESLIRGQSVFLIEDGFEDT